MTASQGAAAVIAAAREAGRTLGCAESLTGGLLAAALTSVPGASVVFHGGIVSYASALKGQLLGVSARLLAERGAVDPEVAAQMARGACRVLGVDLAVATTGVAGPDPADGKPVGTVYVAVAEGERTQVFPLALTGSREQIREASVDAGLAALHTVLGAVGHTR